MKFYVDANIWIDLIEDRKGYRDEPLGEYAAKFFDKVLKEKHTLVISNILNDELKEVDLSVSMKLYKTEVVISSKEQDSTAKKIAKKRELKKNDVLHAILSRDNNCLLITRDKHFRSLNDICKHKRPEDIN